MSAQIIGTKHTIENVTKQNNLYLLAVSELFILTSIFALRPVIDWAKSSGVKQFLFISSAGIYKATDEPPHVEGVCFVVLISIVYKISGFLH